MSIDDKGFSDGHDVTVEANDTVVEEKRGNAADRADMYRMGKAQEMRVRASNGLLVVLSSLLMQIFTEKFPFPIHIWLFHDSHGLLGVLSEVSLRHKMVLAVTWAIFGSANQTCSRIQCLCNRTAKWRHRWFNLDVPCLLGRLFVGQHVHG